MRELDVKDIIIVPSDTEIPVRNGNETKRALCANFPENTTIIDRLEAIKIIDNLNENLEDILHSQPTINCINHAVDELQAIYGSDQIHICEDDLFKGRDFDTIKTIDELKKVLSELLIRFDTNPQNYTKEDYGYLLMVLYQSLLHVYEELPKEFIVTEWQNPHRDDVVPSEKLTKTTIDAEAVIREETDIQLQANITQEVHDREQAILDLLPLIYAGL